MTADRASGPGADPSALHPDAAATGALYDLEAAPLVPAEAREDLLALKSGATFTCTRRDGDIVVARASGEGLYVDDTRHLSELRLAVGGQATVLLSSVMDSGDRAVVDATNPALRTDEGTVPQDTLNIRRTIAVHPDHLHYGIRVRSFHASPVHTTLVLSLGVDFADVFEVRGVDRRTSGTLRSPEVAGNHASFAYVAADGEMRRTEIVVDPAPDRSVVDGTRVHLTWDVALAPGTALPLALTVSPAASGTRTVRGVTAGGRPDASEEPAATHDEWLRACTSVRTDNELFDRFIDAAVRDLHALMMPAEGGQIPAAGIPWYVAPFGRDSIITAHESLMVNPEIARGTLLVLAAAQAKEDEPWRDAEPGKILHELRTGELARTGHIPHTPYYGTVDATPLFLVLAADYHRWTGDLDTMARLRPAFDAALNWIDEHGDLDGDGFVEYSARSPAGLVNQGWKDSHDSIVHADGTLAEGPIALVEVQGYVYAAKERIADVYDALGDFRRGGALRREAARLREAFNDAFWDADAGYFALALDGRKEQVRSITSNPAHCLFAGIVDDAKAGAVAERLMAADMFSGWGVRTLSSASPAFNPMSYHNGSVWPHDNAIAAAGLKRYGFAGPAEEIAGALFDVASRARDMRLPELFCGFDRRESPAVVAYPVACIPQAWAAAAPFLLLQSMLGVSASAVDRTVTVDRPSVPGWMSAIDLTGLQVGNAKVGLSFRRAGRSTSFSLHEPREDVRVTMLA